MTAFVNQNKLTSLHKEEATVSGDRRLANNPLMQGSFYNALL